MTARVRWMLFGIALGALLLCAGGIAAFFGVREYRHARWLDAAQQSFERGDWKNASNYLGQYLPHDPANVDLLTMYADANAHILQDRPAALRNVAHAYHQILRYDPENTGAQTRLLRLYERQGAWDVLEYYASDWLDSAPDSVPLLRARAKALDKAGSRDDAIAAYETLFDHHERDYADLSRYAALIRERSGAPAVEELLNRWIAAKPNDPKTLCASARYWMDAGDIESAKHFLSLAAEAAPTDPVQRQLNARIAASERRWDDALALVASDDPLDAESISLRANLLLGQGEPNSAVKLLAEAAPELRIDHPRLQILLIDSLYGLNQLEKAREAAQMYLGAYPLDTATRNYVDGRDAMAEKRHSDAARALAIAVEMRPDFRAARLALAVAELNSGDVPAGRGVLEAYLREYPGDERALSMWATNFGLDIKEAERLAGATLAADSVDADQLMAAAELMASASIRDGSLAERAESIAGLAQRAAQLSPDSTQPFSVLLGLWLRLGKLEQARNVLVSAKDADIEEMELLELSCAVALAEGDPDRAKSIYGTVVNRLDAEAMRRWSRLFADAGEYREAVRIADFGKAKFGADSFVLDRLELIAQFGRMDEVWNAIEGADSYEEPENAARVRRALMMAAIRFADSGDTAQLDRLHKLRKRLDATEDDAYALVIQALDQWHRDNANTDTVEPLLQAAERAAPDDALVLDRLRAFYEQTNRLDTALDYAQRASSAEPVNDHYRFELGRLQAMNGLFGESERTIRDMLSRAPDNVRAKQLLIQTLFDAGQVEAAKQELAGLATEEVPDRLRSQVLMARDAYADAETILRKRVAESPDDRAARWDLAVCLRELGRADEGAEMLRTMANAGNATAEDWSLLAQYLGERQPGDALADAARAALRALLLDPGHADSLRTLAGIRERQNDPAAALTILRRYTRERPEDSAAWYRQAQLELASGGNWTDALASADRAFSISPDASYRALRGFIHAGLKHYVDAINDLEEAAADLTATSVQFDLTLAECYLRTDRIEQAERALATAARKIALEGGLGNAQLDNLNAELAALKDAS